MFVKKLASFATVLSVLAALCPRADAALFSLSWNFINPEPLFTGTVDTSTDTFTIESWDSQNDPNFWSPGFWSPDLSNTSIFPDNTWTWKAYQADGSLFDIPDNWNGSTNNRWAFISDLEWTSVPWNEGTFESTRPQAKVGFPGLGGYKLGRDGTLPPASGDNIILGFGMLNLTPTAPDNWSFASGTIKVTPIPDTMQTPEASTSVSLLLGIPLLLYAARKRTCKA